MPVHGRNPHRKAILPFSKADVEEPQSELKKRRTKMSTLALRGGRPIYSGTWPKWPVFDQREVERMVQVLRSGNWSFEGPVELEFRNKFAGFLGVKGGVCVTNGTHALQLALEALDVGYGDEVIVPGLTWQATAACALDVNAVPVLVDVEPETLCMDPKALAAAITPRTKAVITVHLYSCVANMDEILAITEKHGIPLIEDCAHQHGSEWRGRKVGSLGKIGTFSFQQSKVLTGGEGGYVSAFDDRLLKRLNALRHCGRPGAGVAQDNLELQPQSGNYRFTEFQAAILNCALARLPEQTARRDENARYLSKILAEIPGITPPLRREQVTRQAYYAYVFRYDKNAFAGLSIDRFRQALKAELGLDFTGTYDPLNASPLFKPQTKRRHRLNDEYWKKIDVRRFQLPQCRKAFEETVSMLHFFLLADSREMEMVAEAIAKIQKHAGELLDWQKDAGADTKAAVPSVKEACGAS
jgi:L-glutamine:2-deoxy-scyllo-inosose/3-amino-2,3-dideoxy-scyllo-inosose aminotransferase